MHLHVRIPRKCRKDHFKSLMHIRSGLPVTSAHVIIIIIVTSMSDISIITAMRQGNCTQWWISHQADQARAQGAKILEGRRSILEGRRPSASRLETSSGSRGGQVVWPHHAPISRIRKRIRRRPPKPENIRKLTKISKLFSPLASGGASQNPAHSPSKLDVRTLSEKIPIYVPASAPLKGRTTWIRHCSRLVRLSQP